MKCEMCGTSVAREAHDRGICFDCYCILSLADYEEHQKKNTEEEQLCIPSPATPSHHVETVTTAGPLIAGVTNDHP